MGIYDSVPQTGLSAFLWGLGDQVAQARQANAEANAVSNQPQQQGILAKLLGFGAPDQQPAAPMTAPAGTSADVNQAGTPPGAAPVQAQGGILGALAGSNGVPPQPQQPPAAALPYAPQDPGTPGGMVRTGNVIQSPKSFAQDQQQAGGTNPYGSQPATTPSMYPAGQGPMPTFAAGQGTPTGILSTPGVANMFTAQENRYGLPLGYLSRTAQIESGGDPNAYNKGSKAAGLFQFIPSTAAQYGLSDPTNPIAATNAAAQLASANAGVLRNALGRDPTPGELYLAHQQGAGGAAQLLANPNARAGDIVGDKAVRANGGDPNMTAGQFASIWTNKFGQGDLAGGGIGGSPAPLRMLAAGGGSPYGGLDPNAFSGQQGGPQGPILAQPGMGGMIPSGGGFALPPNMPTSMIGPAGSRGSGGGMAYSSTGQPQPTDAQGNALDANGQPTALAYGGQTGTAAAPASRAITTATSGQPYGSVPLNVNGRMMTRDQADANKGTDYSDYDDAAAAAGLIPSADAAPAYQPQGAVSTVRAPAPPAVASLPGAVAPAMNQPAPGAAAGAPAQPAQANIAGMSLSSPETQAYLARLLRDPDTNAFGKQIWQALLTRQPVQFQHFEQGNNAYAFNPSTGTAQLLAQGNPAPVVVNKSLVNPQTGSVVYDGSTPDTRTVQPSEYPRYGIPAGTPGPVQVDGDGKLLFPMKQGQTINIDQKAESATEQEYGKAVGQDIAGTVQAAGQAPQALAQIGILRSALASGGNNITTGPFASYVLKGKQAIGGLLGTTLDGVPEAEVINNIGQQLATQGARAISNRPTQFEFAQQLATKPGLSLSKPGIQALLSIKEQDLADQQALARLAQVPGNRQNWTAVKQAYYASHPIMSPFDPSQPFGAQDIAALNASAQGGASPAATATPPAGLPSNARQGTDGNFYVPDPSRPGKYQRVN